MKFHRQKNIDHTYLIFQHKVPNTSFSLPYNTLQDL
jgi:hypothetical protein